ncbi:hypothetical protein BCY91_15160 [Pelobium manganitolerans]|uniref:Uncharacterized protein n=1 Tax=Pelobium manganitolerans TaxID=1842495 RepID=A0A419S9J3_9SPHI|nr:hypothetical protein [Pelobium manganitolerans]RKD18671.1 hypothetical protein BCY91_15160 [Pelobium manganitolerans]
MENKEEEFRKSPEGIEHDYNENQQNPAPAEEAVTEKNDQSAGKTIHWIIPVCLVILFIVYLIVRK